MSNSPLRTYLRTFRRKSELTQDEIAFLLGGRCGTSVSRHERGKRVPTLETALGYEVVLGTPVRQLHAGIARKVEARIRERLIPLRVRVARTAKSSRRDRKVALLTRLLEKLR